MNLKIAAILFLFVPCLNYGMSFDVDGKPIIDKAAYAMEKQSILARSLAGFGITGTSLGLLSWRFNDKPKPLSSEDVSEIISSSFFVGAFVALACAYISYVHNNVCDATNGKTLHGAVADNNAEGVKEYLDKYNSVLFPIINDKDANGYTPVQVAAATGSSQALQVLLEADLGYKGKYVASANPKNLSITLELSNQPKPASIFESQFKKFFGR